MTTIIGVRFKPNGKMYYFDPQDIPVETGTGVIVETARGLEYGECVQANTDVPDQTVVQPLKRMLRVATDADRKTLERNKKRADEAFIVCKRKIEERGLDMNLVTVECTFDMNKMLFYFTADGRVDFRELVKDLASVFRTRIELRQIGVRDEAKMIGGLGTCGRELCCASWISSFSSVTTNTARMQELSLNPQKLAGQCSKLKCCLAYEYDTYADARRDFPRVKEPLQALDGEYYLVKSDILARTMQFSSSKDALVNVTTLSVERVKEIQALNRAGKKVDRLLAEQDVPAAAEEPTYRSEEDSITRFDGKRRNNKRRRGDRKGPTRDRAAEGAAGAEVAAGSEAGASDRGQRGARPVRNPQKGGGSVSGGGENGASQGGERPRGERRSGRRGNGGRNGENRGGEGRNGDGRGERSRQGSRSNRGGSQGNANRPASGPSGENGGGKGDKE